MKAKPVLQVRMLGSFELYYGQEPVHLKKRQKSKPLHLLQLLLHNREDGISRQRVIEALYGPEAEIDTANNLNAAVSQLRRILRDSNLPNENYIHMDVDCYKFKSSFPIQVDTEEVQTLRREAAAARGGQRMELLYRLCSLYRGRFLPELSGENWAEMAWVYYQRIYQESMSALCHMLWDAQDYQEILYLTEFAARLFPYDEWQVWQYESLLAQGRVRNAQELYRETEKLYRKELDAPLPERMRQRIRTSAGDSWREARNVRAVQKQLDEAGREGPYCLPFPSFLDAYNLIRRMSGTAGQPVCLMLCTLRGGDARFKPDRELFQSAMEQLEASLHQTLRQEDAFTRYSRSQYLSVLIGVEETDCGTISQRLSEKFSGTETKQRFALDCQAVSASCIQPASGG